MLHTTIQHDFWPWLFAKSCFGDWNAWLHGVLLQTGLPLADFRHVGPIGMEQRFERERDKTGTIHWEKLTLWGRVSYHYLLLWGSKSLKCLWNQKISPQTMNSGRISVRLFVDLFGRWNLQVIWPDTFLLLSSLRLYSMRQYIPGDI